MDDPRSAPSPPPTSEPARAGLTPAAAVADVLGQLSAMSEAQPAATEALRPRPRQRLAPQQRSVQQQQQQVRLDNERSTSPERPEQPRPMIMVPTPVTLPPRQPPPVLLPAPAPFQQPTLPEASPSYSSPETHERISPAVDAPVFSEVAAATVAEQKTDTGSSWRTVAVPRRTPPDSISPSSAPFPLDSATASAEVTAVGSNAVVSVPSAGIEGVNAATPVMPPAPSIVEEAWGSPLGIGEAGLGHDDSRWTRTNVAGGSGAAVNSGSPSRFSAKASDSGIGEVLRKLREPSNGGGGAMGAAWVPAVQVSLQDSKGRSDEAAAAQGGDVDGLPEWMPRARPAFHSTSGEGHGENSGSSSISAEEEEEGDRGRRRNGAGVEGFSLVSIVAGDIVRAQRQKASSRRLENKVTEEAVVAPAAAVSSREQRQSKGTLLAASEDAVAEAVMAAARVVATEEATRHGERSASVSRAVSPVRGMEAVHDAMAALEERRAADTDRFLADSHGVEDEPRRSSNRPDVWDSLLQSGPTVSPSRRQQLKDSSRSGESLSDGREGSDNCSEVEEPPMSENTPATEGGVDTGGEEGGRNRRLAPAELQAQLLNELRLHDDLQDAELQADGLMAAQKVEEARQEARVAGLLLRRERVRAEQFLVSFFTVFRNMVFASRALKACTRVCQEYAGAFFTICNASGRCCTECRGIFGNVHVICP